MYKRMGLAALTTVICGLRPATAEQSIETVRVAEAPAVDGVLNDAAWTQAATVDNFHVLGSSDAPPFATSVQVCAARQRLYVGFRCGVPGGLNEEALIEGAMRDAVEVFLGPRQGADQYTHFRLGADGGAYAQKVNRRNRDRSWRTPWEHAVAVTKDGWTAEISIPLFALGMTRIGAEPLAINLTRSYKAAGQPQAVAGMLADEDTIARLHEGKAVHVTWALLEGAFHDPDNFGTLTGLTGLEITPAYVPMISRAEALRYGIEDRGFTMVLAIDVVNSGGRAGQATILLEDSPAHAESQTHTRTVTIPPAGEVSVEWVVPINALGERSTRVCIRDADYSHWLPVQDIDALQAVRLFPDRSYYTTESEAHLLCFACFSDEQARTSGLRLEASVRNADGKLIHETSFPNAGQTSIVPMPVSEWAQGVYTATATLRDKEGHLVSRAVTDMHKYPPAPATGTKFDFQRQVLLVNNRPFFPIGYMGTARNGFSDGMLEMLADGGVNCLVYWQGVGGLGENLRDEARKTMADQALRCEKEGIYTVLPLLSFGPRMRYRMQDMQERIEAHVAVLPDALRDFRDVKGVIGWYGLDEPPPTMYKYAQGMRSILQEVDPYRVLYSSNCGDWRPEGYELFDLLGRHGYWMPYLRFSPNKLAKRSVVMRSLARRFRRPFITTPQGFWREPSRTITPHEIRASYFMPLIQGGRGTIIFVLSETNFHPAEWHAQRKVLQQIQQLAPVLLTADPPQAVNVELVDRTQPGKLPPPPASAFPTFQPLIYWRNAELAPIQVLVKNHPAGGELILAANSAPHAREVVFRMKGWTSETRIVNFFDPSTAYTRVGEDAFSDRMEGWAVRVYRTAGPARGAPEEPVCMAVTAVDLDAAVPPERINILSHEAADFESIEELGANWVVREGSETHLDRNDPAEGEQCLEMHSRPDAWSQVALHNVPIEAESRYRFSFRYRNDLRTGLNATEAIVLVPGQHDTLPRLTVKPPLVQEAWGIFEKEFETREPVTARILFRHLGGTGTFWIDDVRIERLGGKKALPKNLLRNGSFEQCTYFGKPDWWLVRDTTDDVEKPLREWETVAPCKEAVSGKLVLRAGFFRESPPPRGGFRNFRQAVTLDLSRNYTFSVYMRADREALPVTLFVRNASDIAAADSPVFNRTFEIGTEWKRYVVPAPFGDHDQHGQREVTVAGRVNSLGNIEIDAAQLEIGTEATAYEEHPYRSPDIGPEYARDTIMEKYEKYLK